MTFTTYKNRQVLTRVTDSYQHKGMMLVTVAVSRPRGFSDTGVACGFEDTCDIDSVPHTIRDLQEEAARWIDEHA